MINAEKVTVSGRDWIRVSFKNIPMVVDTMKTVRGVVYNPTTDFWAVPYQYRRDFENKMGNYLILWKGEESLSRGGIPEERIPSQPLAPGYSVSYGSSGEILSSTGFKRSPWGEFQVKGFNALYKMDFLILADDAGLGKSFQVLTAMEARKKDGNLNRGLIVCKASLLYNWRDEISLHTRLSGVVAEGSFKQRCSLYDSLTYSDDWTFLIISYETYRNDVGILELLHKRKGLDFCILDEAHKVKSPTSSIGTRIHRIPFKCRYVLTATPIPNNPLEAYNYLKWGERTKLSWANFQKRYAIMGGVMDREPIMFKNILELREAIQKNMLRRLKKDKLKELPEATTRTVPVRMSLEQWQLYRAVKFEIMEDLKDTSLDRIPSALAKLTRLQQITDDPSLVGAEVKSSKLEALDELLESLVDEAGQKVIIFSRFKTMVEAMERRYTGYNPAVIHGDVDAGGISKKKAINLLQAEGVDLASLPAEHGQELVEKASASERQKQVYKFQNDDKCKIFLGCAPACREGLTLTAATHVVFLDCEWSPAYVEQAWSRAHRIGQRNALTIHFLVCEGTIDEYVQAVLARKEAMAQAMLDEGVEAVGALKAKELIATLLGEGLKEVS